MEMQLRAKLLTLLLGVCAVINFALLIYPPLVLGPKALHAGFLAYALVGFFMFRWILKVGKTDPARADKLFVRCMFAYWGIPFLMLNALIFI